MEQNTFLYKNILKTKGIKDTTQRQLILTALINSGIHMTAEEIYENLKNKNIGLATIYRNLSVFCKLEILKEIPVNGATYYELKLYNQKPLHIHCKCIKCNVMVDIDDAEINSEYLKINQKVMQKCGLDITDANFIILGVCEKCKSANP